MKKLKVALIQYDTVNPDIEWNTTTAKRLIREASENGADLVLFPECFLTSYSVPDIVEKLLPLQEIEDHPDFIKWCKNVLTEDEEHFVQITNLAAELNIGVVITGFSKGKQYPQNTAWIIDRDGKVLLKYSKVHTCDFDWERYLESGDAFPVCQFDGITMGCMICYDREYPESARELMLNGAELIMHPNSCGGMPPRLKELSVRAMENMVGIAMANPPSEGMGNSCAFSPMVWTEDGVELNNTIFVGEELEETIYYVEFDMDEIRAYREREDLGKYRKPKAYKKLEELQVEIKILEIKQESCPAARFIGKKYTDVPNWDEWWKNGWFDQLETAPRIPFNGDAYLGGVHIVDGMPERWIGLLFPVDTAVPDGFDYVDLEPLDFAVCYLYGKDGSGEFYTMETHDMCLNALAAKGLKRKEDDWCLERYACPNFTTPDEKGNVILDYAISIES